MFSLIYLITTYLLGSDRLLGCLCELLNGLWVMAQIALAPDKDDGEALTEMKHFRDPLKIMSDRLMMAL